MGPERVRRWERRGTEPTLADSAGRATLAPGSRELWPPPSPKSAHHPKAVSGSPQPPEGHGGSPGAFYGLIHWNPGHWEQKREDYERQNTKFLFFPHLNLGRNGLFEGTVFKPSCLLMAGRKDGGGAPQGGAGGCALGAALHVLPLCSPLPPAMAKMP